MRLGCLLLLVILSWPFVAAAQLALPEAGAASAPMESRLFRIIVSHRQFDPFLPWQLLEPGVRAGYGVGLDGNRVLTTEHLIRNQTLIEVEHPRSARKIQAKVIFADPLINLALLSLPPSEPPLPPLPLAPALQIGDDVHIIQLNDGRDVQSASGLVNQLSVTPLPDTSYSALAFHLLSNLNVNGEGAPVFAGDALAGLVFAFQPTTRIASMISRPFLDRFLKDAEQPPYRGSAVAGLTWTPLADPAMRAYLELTDDDVGILVSRVLPGANAALVLRPMDVILSWDGFTLDNLGYYNDPEFGRLDFSNLVKGRRAPDEVVPVTIWRDGAPTNLAVKLSVNIDDRALVPENITGERAEYIISGGILLRELDAFYLRAHGAEWLSNSDPRLVQYYMSGLPEGHKPADRIVILAGVLPDSINSGYHELRGLIVEAVNGSPIRSMADVFALQDRDGKLSRFKLTSMGVDVILDPDALDAANRRIARDYRIPQLEYRRPHHP